MPAATLTVNGLSSGYGRTVIVEDVSFTVPAGQRLAVIGRNGMGKTTLLSTLMGLTTRHAGTIKVEGADVEKLSATRRAYAGLGYVPQTRDIFRTLTVEENLVSGLKGRPKSSLDEAYALFPRLKERRRNLGWQLSGGEQQMLSTTRALLGKPSVLLLDEPLEGLAPVICQELMAAFTELARANTTTIVLVEQNLKTALAFAEEVLVMERGRIVWSGQAQTLANEPLLIEKFMGVAGVH